MPETRQTIYDAIDRERDWQNLMHGDLTAAAAGRSNDARFRVLAEELGEVAKELNDAEVEGRVVSSRRLRTELTHVAAVTVAWLEALHG